MKVFLALVFCLDGFIAAASADPGGVICLFFYNVVNEALNEDGTKRQSQWLKIIGGDYLVKAYQFAHEADPAAQLYYNEYSLENPSKRAGAAALIRDLQSNGVPIAAIGLQGHYQMNWPSSQEVDCNNGRHYAPHSLSRSQGIVVTLISLGEAAFGVFCDCN